MEEPGSSVERIKKLLERRDAGSSMHPRRKLHSERHEAAAEWSEDEFTAVPHADASHENEHVLEALQAGRMPDQDPLAEALHRAELRPGAVGPRSRRLTARFIRTLFFASAAFFVITGAIAAYFLLFSGRDVKCENIEIDVRGPSSVPSGKELTLNVRAKNNNVVPIEGAQLIFDYPEGSRSPADTSIPLPSQREQIGTIDPGESVRATGKVVLFGKEQTEHEIGTRLTFTIKDSSGEWSCPTPFKITLATAPVSVSVAGLEEISSGQELELTVEVRANSEELVRNVRLVAQYPYGFDFLSSDPKPTTKESVWDIGDVAPGTVRTITIRGKVTGYGSESRGVDFAIGEASQNDDGEIGVILQTVEHPFTLTRPFLTTTLALNNSTAGDYSATFGSSIEGVLSWSNDTNETLHDVEIESRLPGVFVERRSVEVQGGFFRSVDNTMIWTPQTMDKLRTIEPGQKGTLAFKFDVVPLPETTSATTPSIDLWFDVRARRIANDIPVEQTLTRQAQRTINFITDVTCSAYALYGIGPFTNTGAHPPRVDNETSYAIYWKIQNTTNDLSNALFTGVLPINVSWLNRVSPGTERVTFNPVTRTVTWDAGTVDAGTGSRAATREVYFQVAVIPSISQANRELDLLADVRCTGVDAFTGTMVQRENPDVTSKLENDPFFPKDNGRVRD